MTTLVTADGRLLRSQRPSAAMTLASQFTSWDRWTDATEDPAWQGHLVSYESIYRSQPTVAAVVDKLARRIATLPFGAYRKLPDGSREPATGDALDTLLRSPWPRSGTVHLLTHIAQSLLIHGNALLAKAHLAGDRDQPPDMLWPLDWSQVSAYGPQGGTIEWWSTTQFGDQERFLAAADTIHFAWLAPGGGEIGVSPLEKLGVTIRLEDAAQRHQTAMFRNGTRPSLGVALDHPNPKPELLEFARQRVEAMHKGADNSGRTFFMGANVKLQPLSLSPVEAALIDQRKLSREEVGMVYDLAGPLMNDLTHGTYSNVAELQKGLYRDVVPPWTTLIVDTCQAQLLDPEPAWLDRVLRFDFTDKLRGEPQEMSVAMRSDVEGGLRTRNEARKLMGEVPHGDPDDPANPANQLTVNANNQAPLADSTGGDPSSAAPALQE